MAKWVLTGQEQIEDQGQKGRQEGGLQGDQVTGSRAGAMQGLGKRWNFLLLFSATGSYQRRV